MQKVPTLFIRDKANPKRVTREVDPDCQWVIAGEGYPTEKYDGSACAVIAGELHRRHAHEAGKGEPPFAWIHWTLDPMQRSGHGWLAVSESNPSDRYHVEAWGQIYGCDEYGKEIPYEDGTYELVGPKVQGNPYGLSEHELWRHGQRGTVFECERSFDAIRELLSKPDDWGLTHHSSYCEGIVWHHHDGRMAKIKRRDFGLPWPVKR